MRPQPPPPSLRLAFGRVPPSCAAMSRCVLGGEAERPPPTKRQHPATHSGRHPTATCLSLLLLVLGGLQVHDCRHNPYSEGVLIKWRGDDPDQQMGHAPRLCPQRAHVPEGPAACETLGPR